MVAFGKFQSTRRDPQAGGGGEFCLTFVEGEEGIGAENEGGGNEENVEGAGGGAAEVMRHEAVRLGIEPVGGGFAAHEQSLHAAVLQAESGPPEVSVSEFVVEPKQMESVFHFQQGEAGDQYLGKAGGLPPAPAAALLILFRDKEGDHETGVGIGGHGKAPRRIRMSVATASTGGAPGRGPYFFSKAMSFSALMALSRGTGRGLRGAGAALMVRAVFILCAIVPQCAFFSSRERESCRGAKAGTEALETPHIFNTPEVVKAGGMAALQLFGEPAALLSNTKERLFAA